MVGSTTGHYLLEWPIAPLEPLLDLIIVMTSYCKTFEGRVSVEFIYVHLIFKWLAVIVIDVPDKIMDAITYVSSKKTQYIWSVVTSDLI